VGFETRDLSLQYSYGEPVTEACHL
jgi:hypothetical protein